MEYEIIYSNRKTITLCIKNASLVVKAPFGTPTRKIESLVLSHKDWVEKSIKKQRQYT